MDLLRFRVENRLTWAELEKRTGVPRTNLNAIAFGKRDASAETMRMIEDGTNGAVTPNDIQKTRREHLASQEARAA